MHTEHCFKAVCHLCKNGANDAVSDNCVCGFNKCLTEQSLNTVYYDCFTIKRRECGQIIMTETGEKSELMNDDESHSEV